MISFPNFVSFVADTNFYLNIHPNSSPTNHFTHVYQVHFYAVSILFLIYLVSDKFVKPSFLISFPQNFSRLFLILSVLLVSIFFKASSSLTCTGHGIFNIFFYAEALHSYFKSCLHLWGKLYDIHCHVKALI